MESRSRSTTTTKVTSGIHTAQGMGNVILDLTTVVDAAPQLRKSCDLEGSWTDVSILVLNDLITAILFDIYVDDELVRQYRYEIQAEDAIGTPEGAPAGEPPTGYVPDDARARLLVVPNKAVPEAIRTSWFERLGWVDAEPLRFPENAEFHTFGRFSSGPLHITRGVLSNPRFDRPLPAAERRAW